MHFVPGRVLYSAEVQLKNITHKYHAKKPSPPAVLLHDLSFCLLDYESFESIMDTLCRLSFESLWIGWNKE